MATNPVFAILAMEAEQDSDFDRFARQPIDEPVPWYGWLADEMLEDIDRDEEAAGPSSSHEKE